MNIVKTEFYSDALKLKGSFYLPKNFNEKKKYPLILVNSGYQGFNEFYPKLFSEKLTEKDFICFGFDYRGFADSEGIKGRVVLSEQVSDIKHAITHASTHPNVDATKIGLVGWGMGANNVLHVAAKDKRVKAVAALNGFYNGERWLKLIHSPQEWSTIEKVVEEDRKLRAESGQSRFEDTFIHYPLDPATADYVKKELAPVYGFGNKTQLIFTDSIIETDAEEIVGKISPRPVFIAHGKDNLLHPISEAHSLYQKADTPKILYTIDGKHNDFMYSNHNDFIKLNEQLDMFFKEHVGRAGDVLGTEKISSLT
ncbi:alpha/beta hydrolase [Peribacillus muralis]|uniref:alpha/beta hydrolase n=1 Tax=Peribacillus muralis TaxID=264697 RepID=UPI00366F6E92